MKRFTTLATLAVSLGCGTAQAQEIRQFDEVCVTQWKLACMISYSTFAVNLTLSRDQKALHANRIAADNMVQDALEKVERGVVTDFDPSHEPRCDTLVRAYMNCGVTLDLAKAVDKAVRESQAATLKAWLAALDAREVPPAKP